jgi:hypothetical protein
MRTLGSMSTSVVRLTKLYNYPAHAVSVFDRVVHEQAKRGLSLRSVSKGHLLGSGVSLKFEFIRGDDEKEYRLTYRWGRFNDPSDKDLEGWVLIAQLPMRFAWMTIGNFFVLARPRHAA